MNKLCCFLLISTLSFAQLPDGPKPQAPPHDRLFNKKFILSTAALFGSSIYDAEVSHAGIQRGNCLEAYGNPRSSRGQLYARMLPIDGVIFGFALLMRKGRVPVAPYVMLLGGAGRHLYVGSQWFTEGCL